MTLRTRRLGALAAVIATFFLAACSSSSQENGAPEQTERVALVVTGSELDGLLSFSATIEEVRFRNGSGVDSEDLLPTDARVVWVGDESSAQWLAQAETAQDVSLVSIQFDPGSYTARAADGSVLEVIALSDEWLAPLPPGSSGTTLELNLDLRETIVVGPGPDQVTFDPTGLARRHDGSSEIDEIRGVVTDSDAAALTLTVDAFADGDGLVPIGAVVVSVETSTTLVTGSGALFSSAADFFALLGAGTTTVEVHGRLLADLSVSASRIEIEDGFGVSGGNAIEIEGTILNLDSASGFDLLVHEIEKGALTAAPVLAAQPDPARIHVLLTPSTLVFLDSQSSGDDGVLTTVDALANGQRVDVRFSAFLEQPFPAGQVEIEQGGVNGGLAFAEFEGTIVELAELPTALTAVLDSDDPALLSGDVASANTIVRVELDEALLQLDTDGEPGLALDDLSVGLEFEAAATLSGDPSEPVLDAIRLKVRAGRLDDATVTAVAPESMTFETLGGEIDDPFGGGVSPGPFQITIEPTAVFNGDAESAAQFFALFADGNDVEVRVEGIADSLPNRLRAFEIDVKTD